MYVSPTVQDIVWLAGLLEGEGCFNMTSVTHRQNGYTNKYQRVSIVLAMTDQDVVAKVGRLWNLAIRPIPRHSARPAKYKPMWEVRITGKRAVGWMLTIYKFMGERRQAKIRDMIAGWEPKLPYYVSKRTKPNG